MACISRYQAGTKATRSRPASWLRSENRHAVGNCPNAATCGGAGGRRVRSVADIGTLRSGGTNGEAAIGEIGQHVEPALFDDQVGDDHNGPAASAQVADDIPEPQVGLPVETLIGLIKQQ